MNRCSVCAREIPDTATVCDVCGKWAAEPVAAESASALRPPPPTLADMLPTASGKIALFPVPEIPAPKPVAPAAPVSTYAHVAPAAPVVSTAPGASAAPSASATPAVAAAPGKPSAPAKPAAARFVTAKFSAPAALATLKGRRGLMAGFGVAAMLAIGFLVARPAPPAETAAVTPKPQGARPKASPVPQVEAALDVKWSVNSKRWGANQKKSIAIELSALNRVQVWMRQVQPMLVVRCVSKNTEAFVFTESAMAMEPNTPDHTVRIAFDDEPQKIELWPDSVEHDSLFAPDGAAFARRLMTARTLQFGFTPHNAPAVVARFQVNGLPGLIEPAARDCGWK